MVTTTSEDLSRVYVRLVAIIFAVIIGVSFTDFKDILVPPSPDFKTATLLLAYTTVVASFVGYHQAVAKHPHRNVGRFIVDLILLYLYFYLIYSIEDFRIFLTLFPYIFGLYLLWAFLRSIEYRGTEKPVKAFELSIRVIRAYTIWVASFGVWAYHLVYSSSSQEPVLLNATYVDWTAWGFTLALVLLYRFIELIIPRLAKRWRRIRGRH